MQSPVVSRVQRASSSRTTKSPLSLPRLPVPDLRKTLRSYLQSLVPLLLEDEARGGPDFRSAYDVQSKLVEDFEGNLGQLCQQRLLELDASSPHNWLNDNIWLKKAYHEWRAPLIVNSNWWLALADDPGVPDAVRFPVQQFSGYTTWQIRRAAWLVCRILDFKARLERQDVYPDSTRTGLWFRHAALQFYNTCRIPQRGCDSFPSEPSPANGASPKLLVTIADWLYSVDVVNSDGLLPPAVIERCLRSIVRDVEGRLVKGERAVPINVLTTDERDRWADNLKHLLSLSPCNQAVYNTVTSSVFALSLDNYTYTLPPPLQTEDSDLTAHLHNIRSGHGECPGHNRWYDKPFTLIVESNTRTGVLGEHSPVDALVPSIVADYAIVEGLDEDAFPDKFDGESWSVSQQAGTNGWQRLDWVVDDLIANECKGAAQRAKAIVDDSDVDELVFNEYGIEWIKQQARVSPDAYIQMALQLAWYRTRGEFTATYETALTRGFHHGRTETIRTLSADSRAWVLAMTDPQSSDERRFELFRRALETHKALTRSAAMGRGIDRHLLGLRLMLRGESHPLFENPMFTRSLTWKLSTSGLSEGYQFRGTGFGAPYNDGYGVSYMPASDRLRFGIESKHSCSQTSTTLFKKAITNALQELKGLCTSTLLQSHL